MTSTITNEQIERAKTVLENHLVKPLTRAGAIENGLFCIASQATEWELPSRFIRLLRQQSRPQDPDAIHKYATLEVLTDKAAVNAAAKKAGWRFPHQDRFGPFIDYFGFRKEPWWDLVKGANSEFRESQVRKIHYMGCKTYSFWHICLGGRNLIALDVYVMKGLNNLGIELNGDFWTPVKRPTDGQRVRRTPPKNEYLRIEQAARELFAQDERFVIGRPTMEPKRVDMALVDAVLWWKGANRGDESQRYLFGGDRSGLILPYAESEKYNPPEEP